MTPEQRKEAAAIHRLYEEEVYPKDKVPPREEFTQGSRPFKEKKD